MEYGVNSLVRLKVKSLTTDTGSMSLFPRKPQPT